jgi:hypothetical protein
MPCVLTNHNGTILCKKIHTYHSQRRDGPHWRLCHIAIIPLCEIIVEEGRVAVFDYGGSYASHEGELVVDVVHC